MPVLLVCALAIAGCAGSSMTAAPAPSSGLSCAEAGRIDAQVAPEVEVVGLECYIKSYKGDPSLHFDVKLKNVSSADQRYRVNFFLDNGKAVGGLVPPTGKPPVVKPGMEASFSYPVKGMAEKAGNVTLLVKTVSQ
jgi:hypothetical protein